MKSIDFPDARIFFSEPNLYVLGTRVHKLIHICTPNNSAPVQGLQKITNCDAKYSDAKKFAFCCKIPVTLMLGHILHLINNVLGAIQILCNQNLVHF